MQKEKELKKEIIDIGRRLYDFRLTAACGGNLSARIEGPLILITVSGSCLGELKEEDILKVDLNDAAATAKKGLTAEFPLHSLIYKSFPARRVIHCHPPLTNAYYSVCDTLETITFESKLFLGEVPVITQNTPNISQPMKAIEALKVNNIIAIKNHGVVCMGDSFKDAFYLIEELEEAVKISATARLFSKKNPDKCDVVLKKTLKAGQKAYSLFSREHILKIVSLINQDKEFMEKSGELGLTTALAIKADDAENNKSYKFNFREGKIEKVEYTEAAPFVISGPLNVWRLIFEGKLNPFVATTQGKLKLTGDMGKLARWYVPFQRMFSLFKEIKIQ